MNPVVLETREVTPDFAAAVWNEFVLLEWRKPITLPALRQFEMFSQRLTTMPRQFSSRGLMVLVNSETAIPPADVRQAMAEGMKRRSTETRSICMVFAASGMQATVLRSILAAVTVMARQKVPSRVFGTIPEGAAWLSEVHGKVDLAQPLCLAAQQLQQLTVSGSVAV